MTLPAFAAEHRRTCSMVPAATDGYLLQKPAHTHTHTHTFNGPFSGTIQVSRYLKGKTNLDFTEARDSEWQWHQLGHMQVCTLLQTDNHTSTPPLSFLQAGCPSCCPTNSVKALKASQHSAANPLATVAADDRRDRRTDAAPLHRPCCAYYAASVMQYCVQEAD